MIESPSWRGPSRMPMKVEVWSDRKTIVCSVAGDLDRYSFADFAAKVDRLIRPNVHIAFDLSHLGFIDTSGLRALRVSARRISRGGGHASATNVPCPLAKLLVFAGIDGVMPLEGLFRDAVPRPAPAS
jgi:anti-anti-sigma factor